MDKFKWEDKVWGKVAHLFHSPYAAVSYLKLIQNTRCSCHMHNERVNEFHLISGKVVIEQWLSGVDSPSVFCIMKPGDCVVIATHVWHRFRVIDAGEMIEIYSPANHWCRVALDDIVRADEGGIDEELRDALKEVEK